MTVGKIWYEQDRKDGQGRPVWDYVIVDAGASGHSLQYLQMASTAAQTFDAKTLSRLREGSFEILQLDATAYPGNSGSPLLDADTGLVIGIVNMVYVKGTKESAIGQPTGITYAIPVRFLAELLARP